MPNSRQIIQNAYRQGLTVPAFNIPYLPMVQPVIRAVADADCFALVTVARLEWMKFESQSPTAVATEFAKHARPECVRLHLDHVPVIDEDGLAVDYLPIFDEAIAAGFASLMVDASRLDLAGNIAVTRRIADKAHAAGIPCEAELGAVLGHEAGPLPDYDTLFESGMGFTDVEQARRFVAETGCDWLSVAIGSVHGAITGVAKDRKKPQARLNLDHLRALRDATGIPLVLHGGSGVKQDALLAAVKLGIAKVNVATEIRQPYEAALRETGDVEAAREAVYERTVWLLKEYFELAGTRAALVEGDG